MSLLSDNKGPDQTGWMHRLIRAFVVRKCQKTHFPLALLKWWYQVNIFLISPEKRTLWVLVGSTTETLPMDTTSTSNEYPQQMFFWRNKKNINSVLFEKKNCLELYSYGCLNIVTESF